MQVSKFVEIFYCNEMGPSETAAKIVCTDVISLHKEGHHNLMEQWTRHKGLNRLSQLSCHIYTHSLLSSFQFMHSFSWYGSPTYNSRLSLMEQNRNTTHALIYTIGIYNPTTSLLNFLLCAFTDESTHFLFTDTISLPLNINILHLLSSNW